MCSCPGDVPVSGQQVSLKVLMLLGLPAPPWGGHCRKDSERYFGTWSWKWLAEVVVYLDFCLPWKILLGSAPVEVLCRLELAGELPQYQPSKASRQLCPQLLLPHL